MSVIRPNLDLKGRLIRGAGAVTLATGASLLWSHSRIAALGLAASAGFVASQAAHGWCALRACGVKTKF